MKEGDIFRWRYLPEVEERYRERGDPYWCKSRIAVVKHGRLWDTYWHDNAETSELRVADVSLEHVANFDDLENRSPYYSDYYDQSDIVDLRHSNNSRDSSFFVRKGAKRSKSKMLAVVDAKIRRSEWDKRSAEQDITRFTDIKRLLEEGADIDKVYL